MDKKLRRWGRRLLLWPSGAPGAAVLGELGWAPFRFEVSRDQFRLFGRRCSVNPAGAYRGVAARVFRYALEQQGSWAHGVVASMRELGIDLPPLWGLFPRCSPNAVFTAWTRPCMLPTLYWRASAASQAEVDAAPSLRMFARCHPNLSFCTAIHCLRLFSSHVREWTLARCGHHPFMDGRSARHRFLVHPCLCGAHVKHLSDDALLQLLLSPHHPDNAMGVLSAHVHFVAGMCATQRSLLATSLT